MTYANYACVQKSSPNGTKNKNKNKRKHEESRTSDTSNTTKTRTRQQRIARMAKLQEQIRGGAAAIIST